MRKTYRLEYRGSSATSPWHLSCVFEEDQVEAFQQFVADLNPPDELPRLRITENRKNQQDDMSEEQSLLPRA
jgi:hypothetical protein